MRGQDLNLQEAAIGLDAIAVRIDDERGVVVGAVVAAQAGCAVVAAPFGESGGMESVDALARRGWRAGSTVSKSSIMSNPWTYWRW